MLSAWSESDERGNSGSRRKEQREVMQKMELRLQRDEGVETWTGEPEKGKKRVPPPRRRHAGSAISLSIEEA